MKKQYDVVIAGSGLAGLYGALSFDSDVSILLLAKKSCTLCNSSLAQGGIAAVLDHRDDNFELHIKDTLIAGKYENNIEAVKILVNEGPSDVLRINLWGVDFDINDNFEMNKTLEGGHCRNRIVHHKDFTGKECVDKLLEVVRKKENITILEDTMLYDIKQVNNGFNISLLKDKVGSVVACRYLMLATGGIGRIYPYTTNSAIATGDGIALANKLGANIKHLNYIQFHPTAFAAKDGRERFLISESVRGEGAILKNCNKETFTHKYDERGDLAPRDVVCDDIVKEAQATNSNDFYLDITHEDPEFLKERFPLIYKRCLEENVDITKDLIPVFPCQHYLMGGIDVNLNSKTTIDHLYACGECSHTCVHGANRLASNSLLEALVFSRRAAMDITKELIETPNVEVELSQQSTDISGATLPTGIRTRIREIMSKVHFVNKHPELYAQALVEVDNILKDMNTTKYAITPDYIEAYSLASVASIVLMEDIEDDAK
ncbi:MAG: L-aspartate oxidase [Erysipelotrichaceae bacterium]